MKSIGIATDSHSGILPARAKELGVMVLPMPFFFGEECYYEEVSITRQGFFERLNAGETVSTSQPSPEAVMQFWRDGLKEYESIVYIPMSSGLSGSCHTAMMLATEEEFEGKVFVVDNGRIATLLHRSVLDALELVEEGYSAEKIKEILEADKENMAIYIAVETLEYLKKGGRITATTAALGTLLNIKPVLRLGVGVLDTYKKSRGMRKAKNELLATMKQEMETTYKDAVERGEFYLMAASSADEETTKAWVEEIEAYFPGWKVMCDYLTMGISCHTGEGALGIGCSCKPKRS